MIATVVPPVVVTGAFAAFLALFLRLEQHTAIIQMMIQRRPHKNTAAITTPTIIPVMLALVLELVDIVTDSVGSVPVRDKDKIWRLNTHAMLPLSAHS